MIYLPFMFPTKILCAFLTSLHAIRHADLTLLNLIALILFAEEYKYEATRYAVLFRLLFLPLTVRSKYSSEKFPMKEESLLG
jgi:hypothetical protein